MEAIQYSEANNADIQGMAQIRAAQWQTEEYWTARIKSYMLQQSHPQQALSPRIVLVATHNGYTAGFIAGHLTTRFACDGELQWINTAANYQRRGIAKELLKLLAGWFVQQNTLRVCVNADPENLIARQFYVRHGAEYLNDYWLVWNDITVVLKSL